MEKFIIKSWKFKYQNQTWFVLLISCLLGFLLISLNYFSLPKNNSLTILLTHHQNFPGKTLFGKQENKSYDKCFGKYIYVHEDLPSQFNMDLVQNCHSLVKGTDFCFYLENLGFGPKIQNSEKSGLSKKNWYETNQFSLEVIFHNKMKNYKCLTNDSSMASAIYVPYYAGLDVGQYLWGFNISIRDSSAKKMVKWVSKKPEWKKMWGRDHFMVGGRISWDFRRKRDNDSDWGNKLMFLPESKNMTMLSIEKSVWTNDLAIPYPTYFHPFSDNEILEWQQVLRNQTRKYLFSFVGAPRNNMQHSIRGQIIKQCQESKRLCNFLACKYGDKNKCDNPIYVMKTFKSSKFCLQPSGDSFTRRSTFDSILAGCIPVFFHPSSAYKQYVWYFPKNHTKYSVFIRGDDIREGKVRIEEILKQVTQKEVMEIREEVIGMIPRVIYGNPRSRLEGFEDAFDVAIKGILQRVERVREKIEQGKDPSIGFADETSSLWDTEL